MFTRVRSAVRSVYPVSLGSLVFALGVVEFIQGCWVHIGSPLGSLGSSGVVGFIRVRPGGRWVRSVVGCVHPRSLSLLRFTRCWFHSDSP